MKLKLSLRETRKFFQEIWDGFACWAFGHDIKTVTLRMVQYNDEVWYRFECNRPTCKATCDDIVKGE